MGNMFNVDGLFDLVMQKKCVGLNFLQVLVNVISVKMNVLLFQLYMIIIKMVMVMVLDGSMISVLVKVGIISFMLFIIMSWDKCWFDGKVYIVGIKEIVVKYILEMCVKGVDLVVVILYGGLDNLMYLLMMENGSWWLFIVLGIDVMLIGYLYQFFLDVKSIVSQFNLLGVDKVVGIVNGVLIVMVNYWGKYLGVIKFGLMFNGMNWVVDKMQIMVEVCLIQNVDKIYVVVDLMVLVVIVIEY